jgi:hypothetical protein
MFSFRNFVIITAVLSIGVFTQLPAQTAGQAITHRQIKQAKRIRQGVKSGQLTRQETRVLRAEQRKIERDKLRAESKGRITRKELHKIKAEQKAASRDIYRKKHNNRVQ